MNKRKFTLGVKTSYGKVEERLSGHMPLDEIPDDCGYEKKFKFVIDMQSNGLMAQHQITHMITIGKIKIVI